MSVCRSCNQPIEWIKLESGKNHPVDASGYYELSDAKPGEVLVTDSGKVMKINEHTSYGSLKGRYSHFATCPQANEWRKKER